MNDAAPKPPPVPHSRLYCLCRACIAERQAEVRRRIEDARREAQRIAAAEELAGRGIVFAPPKKAQPGTLRALVAMSRRRSA